MSRVVHHGNELPLQNEAWKFYLETGTLSAYQESYSVFSIALQLFPELVGSRVGRWLPQHGPFWTVLEPTAGQHDFCEESGDHKLATVQIEKVDNIAELI